jgi:hypothetical protein
VTGSGRGGNVSIQQDIRFAVRRLVTRRACTALIVLTLALGIGASTALFSVVDQTILRPAPFLHADRLVDVLHVHRVTTSGGSSLSGLRRSPDGRGSRRCSSGYMA